jgi:hypothetical protein
MSDEPIPTEKPKRKDELDVNDDARRVRVFMDGVDWDYEVGTALGGNKVYPSIECLRECIGHNVDRCGIVEVEMTLVRIVQPGERREWVSPMRVFVDNGHARLEWVPPDPVRVFMDKAVWDYEVGTAWGGTTVHPAPESLRAWHQPNAGNRPIVEVEMTFVRIVQPCKR